MKECVAIKPRLIEDFLVGNYHCKEATQEMNYCFIECDLLRRCPIFAALCVNVVNKEVDVEVEEPPKLFKSFSVNFARNEFISVHRVIGCPVVTLTPSSNTTSCQPYSDKQFELL